MASILRTPSFLLQPLTAGLRTTTTFQTPKRSSSLKSTRHVGSQLRISSNLFLKKTHSSSVGFIPFASYEETTETTSEVEVVEETQESSETAADEVPAEESNENGIADTEDELPSVIMTSLHSYKEALASNDESTVAELEAFFLSIEEEKISLENEATTLSEELSSARDRTLRISADFDNFRKRTDRERLSLVTNAQGEVVETLLPVLDNFERAKSQIKVETEGEKKINDSYQSIYKQFVEILGSLGVVPVETVGGPFDPLLHEAIMREDSDEYEEGIILQEFRKGFKLGERLLRPAMVKVSAGPGPAKSEEPSPSEDADTSNETTTTSENSNTVNEEESA